MNKTTTKAPSKESSGKRPFLVMKNLAILLFFVSIQVSASVLTPKEVTLQLQNASLKECLEEIEKQTKLGFLYNGRELNQVLGINANYVNEDVKNVLNDILSDQGYDYDIKDDVILIKKETPKPETAKEEQETKKTITITGSVRESNGKPLPFAAVCFKGTTSGCVSAIDGTYSLEAPMEAGLILEISSLGFKTKEIEVNNRTTIDVILEEEMQGLDEVVITGYQTISKERATGAFDIVSSRQLERPSSSISERLVGSTAGVQTTMNADGEIDFQIRGLTSLGANSKPLVVVDGFPIEGDFASINPNDVETVTVLKDAAAASIWGAQAANGVIVVTTQKAQNGKAKVEVSSFWKLSSKLDLNYLIPHASSAEAVEYDKMGVESGMFGRPSLLPAYQPYGIPEGRSQAVQALNDFQNGNITEDELNSKLNSFSSLSNQQQISDDLLQSPLTQQYNVTVTGGSEGMSNILSVMFENDKNNFKGNSKNNFMANFRNNTEITKWLDFSFSGMLQYRNEDYSGVTADEISTLSPYDMLRNDDGSNANLNHLYYYSTALYDLIPTENFPYSDWSYNPKSEINEREFLQKQINSRIQAGLKFKIIEGLTIDSKFMYEIFSTNNSNYYSGNSFAMRQMVNETTDYDIYGSGALNRQMAMGGSLQASNSEINNYSFRNQANFNKTINEKHSFNVIAGTEVRNRVVNSRSDADLIGYDNTTGTSGRYEGNDYYSDYNFVGDPIYYYDYRYIISNPWYDLPSITSETDRYFSLYANAGYTLNDKYTFSASIRTDASNIIAEDPKYRYSPFWSVGGGWQMHKENFLSDATWVNRLNVRATYGLNGNVDRSTSVTPLIVLNQQTDIYSKDNDASVSSYGNPFLRWETTRTVDLGVDFAFWRNKLRGTVDVYHKESSDLIVASSLPSYNGTDNVKYNNGEMINKGIEISVGTTLPLIRNQLVWSGNLNFSYNHNTISKLLKTYYTYYEMRDYQVLDDGTLDRSGAYVQGYDANALWSINYGGVENFGSEAEPNMLPVYNGADGSTHHLGTTPTGDDAREYMQNQGTIVAPYIMGLTNNFQYKEFEFSFIVTGKFGHVFRRTGFNYPTLMDPTTANKLMSEVVNGDPNEIVPIPTNDDRYFYYSTYTPYMSYLTANASHVRIQEVNLSYTVPSNLSRNWGFDRIKVFTQINNLGTILFNDYGEDPEFTYGNIKPQAIYTLGFNFTL